ncbi:hypothetical protein [Nocardioides coralli]|uniref:hypothetical protein n=1 Tax=Nocardioides coralli TaxID=2872154 RepID=UPI001CA40B1E|nr:hypothetical protein [Nocardioides coralli]QZY30436.1 hypothetical protein K6T13_07215 [Nocardioides coralli]
MSDKTPHEDFARHFTDPLYDDAGEDLAPFGSDEGSDLLWEWSGRREELGASSTVATILGCDPDEVATVAGPMEGVDGMDTAVLVTSAAFVLLRLTGRIPEADCELALRAIDVQAEILPTINPDVAGTHPVLATMRRDLAAWRNPAA